MVDAALVGGVVFAGVVLGAFGRAMFPYLRKLKEQEDAEAARAEAGTIPEKPIKFQRKYYYSAIFSAVVSLFVGMTLYPGLVDSALKSQIQEIEITNGTARTDIVPVEETTTGFNIGDVGNTGLAGIFISSFLTAWGTNSIVNNIIATGAVTSSKVTPGPITKPTAEGTSTKPTTSPTTTTTTTHPKT
jgi:hypothetical protein